MTWTDLRDILLTSLFWLGLILWMGYGDYVLIHRYKGTQL